MIASLKTLDDQRAQLGQQMRQMIADAGDAGLTAEQEATFDKMDAEYERLKRSIARAQKAEELGELEAEHRERQLRAEYLPNPKGKDSDKPTSEDYELARRAWFLGSRAPDHFHRAAEKVGLQRKHDPESDPWDLQFRGGRAPRSLEEINERYGNGERVTRSTTTAQSITTTGGGHTIQNEMMREIEIALLLAGGMRECGAEVWRTGTGATLPVPTVNDTTNKSVVIAINTAADVEALVFGQKTYSAYRYSTGIVLVPMELMQDTTVPLPQLIGAQFGLRMVKGTNNHFTVGVTSDTQPNGIVTDALVGATTSDVNTIVYNDLVNLEHSVDPAYRRDPSAGWLMADSALKVIKKLVDGSSRPLWNPALAGLAGGFPDTILGYRYTINQDMASIATATTGAGAKKIIVFGALNRFKIRDVLGLRVLRLDERYAEKGQTGFIGYHRHDSGAVIASTDTPPFRHLVTKAT